MLSLVVCHRYPACIMNCIFLTRLSRKSGPVPILGYTEHFEASQIVIPNLPRDPKLSSTD